MNRFSLGAVHAHPQRVVVRTTLARSLPDDFLPSNWLLLKSAVSAIFSSAPVPQAENLYRTVESICMHKLHRELFQLLRDECSAHVDLEISSLASRIDARGLVDDICAYWKKLSKIVQVLRGIFLPLDRFLVLEAAEVRRDTLLAKDLVDMIVSIFQVHFRKNAAIADSCRIGVLEMVKSARSRKSADPVDALRMFMQIGFFQESLEAAFLRSTLEFYEDEGKVSRSFPLKDFLINAESRLAEEEARGVYLPKQTTLALLEICKSQLLTAQLPSVIHGIAEMVEDDSVEDLKRLARLAAKVKLSSLVVSEWSGVIKRMSPGEEISRLISFRRKMQRQIHEAFEGADVFNFALKESLEGCMNIHPNLAAQNLAQFFDACLRSSTDEAALTDASQIFRYLSAKDAFEAFYRQDMAKRFLMQKGTTNEATERQVISMFKAECGAVFTSRLEGVLKDVDSWEALDADFRKEASEIDFSANVLTTGVWPSYAVWPATIYPASVQGEMDRFKAFYCGRHAKRSLQWVPLLGEAVLKAHFTKKKDLVMSHGQALVLLLLNENDMITIEDARSGTGIPAEEISRCLLTLVQANVLMKVGDACYRVNDAFEHGKYRVTIPSTMRIKEVVDEEVADTHAKINEDRQAQIDAGIVRIMKAKKSLSYSALCSELYQLLPFPAQPTDVKKQVESLIEREYLERDGSDTSLFHYLA